MVNLPHCEWKEKEKEKQVNKQHQTSFFKSTCNKLQQIYTKERMQSILNNNHRGYTKTDLDNYILLVIPLVPIKMEEEDETTEKDRFISMDLKSKESSTAANAPTY